MGCNSSSEVKKKPKVSNSQFLPNPDIGLGYDPLEKQITSSSPDNCSSSNTQNAVNKLSDTSFFSCETDPQRAHHYHIGPDAFGDTCGEPQGTQ